MGYLEKVGAREPGEPRLPGVIGAPPTPSTPNQTVTPPAPATAPVGRPPASAAPFSGGAGPSLPLSGATAPAATPRPGTTGAATSPVAPAAGPPPSGPGISESPTPMTFSMNRVPSRSELAGMPQGVQIQTPYGTVDQSGKLTLSPDGAVKYQQAVIQKRNEFGVHPFANDPSAPPPPIKLGKPFINPFTGKWGK